MTMTRAELRDAAEKAFGGELAPDPQHGWNLIADMGWLMMAVPEEQGGLGLGREAAGVIHHMLGKALVPGPAIAQMLVTEALTAADGLKGRTGLLERAMAGEVMTSSLAAQGNNLSCIPDADRASHILLIEQDRILLLPTEKVTVQERATWDKTRRLFDILPGADGAGLILAEGEAARHLAKRLESSRLFYLAADSLGGAEAVLALTIDYLQTRRQFDRPLALFQALKHRIADLKTGLATAEALLWSRAVDPDASLTAFGALKAHADHACRAVAEEAIQLHGGIGLTMEHPCHLFLKRIMLNCTLGGDADQWEERAGQAALETSAA